MDLGIRQLADLMEVNEKQIMKWIKDKKMPVSTRKEHYTFNKTEVSNWVIKNNIKVAKSFFSFDDKPNDTIKLSEIISSTGIYYNIKGGSADDVLNNALKTVDMPQSINIDTAIKSFIDREKMMSTAVGRGVALPHSRSPIVSEIADERVAICFLEKAIDYGAIDGSMVHTLFLILSSNPKRHLEMLSKISFLLQQDDFIKMLENRVIKEILIDYIKDKETNI